jgi:hypothetical protein
MLSPLFPGFKYFAALQLLKRQRRVIFVEKIAILKISPAGAKYMQIS